MLEYDNGPRENTEIAKDGLICLLVDQPEMHNLLFLIAIIV